LNKQLQAFGLQPLPHAQKLTGLFSLLAPGNQNTPSFFPHDSYSDNFTSTKRGIEILENTLQKELKRLSEKAAKLLDKKIVPEEIVVSRFQKDIVETLFQNDLFYLKSENFANYCFGLRKNETMIECEQKIDLLREKLTIFEAEIRKNLTREVSNSLKDLIDSQKKIGEFDWNLAKANFAISFGCSIPKVTTEKEYHLPQARNLPIAWELEAKSFAYQPVSMTIENQLNVLTGANMAGKTTLLKMLGQIQFLAAFAIPVPTENARLPLVDFIFFSGLYEERMDLSSFGTEIVMLQEKMKKDGFGLFLIDEFARGTNPAEGEAISKAILEEFSKKNCVTIFSTHFHAPTTVLTTNHYQIVGLTEKDISLIKKETKKDLSERLKQLHQFMNYDVIKVSPQTEPPRAALLVAELLGVDEHIIKKAYQFLEDK
jgi:DNA mismatch repair ATPase MutS